MDRLSDIMNQAYIMHVIVLKRRKNGNFNIQFAVSGCHFDIFKLFLFQAPMV
jgi:hypothetical protein